MSTILKHLLLSILAGVVLATAGWLCWWGGSLALGSAPGDELPIVLALGIGSVSAALVGVCMSLHAQRQARRLHEEVARLESAVAAETKRAAAALATNDHPAPPRRTKRPRHPLGRNPRARWSPSMRWQAVSKSLQRLLRISAPHVMGKSIFQLVHPEDVPGLDKALQDARATRQARQVLCRWQTATGAVVDNAQTSESALSDTKVLPVLHPSSLVYARLEIAARWHGDGTLRCFDCRIVDLTREMTQKEMELRTARRAMSNAKKRFRSLGQDLARLKLSYHELYHNAPVMYFSINRQGDLVTFNDTLLRILGYERPQLQGRRYTDLLAPAAMQNRVGVEKSLPVREGEFETQWRKRDGTPITVWIHTVPVHDELGLFARHRCAALDLTEKNRLANELRTRGDELESMNKQLRLTNKELEDFTHVVSHDLKEPLRTLQAYSHILAEEHGAQLGPDGFQYINHLIRASRRLGVLIDELLQLSQAGRITRAPAAFNLIEIVATVRQDLVDLIQRKQATLATEGSLPDLVGDPVRITQLLTNLAANGLKYNQAAAPRIVIGSVPCEDDPGRVTIFLRDNGIGIDPTYHQQIFGIFRRLHQSEEYEGTGAGLAICKKIVEAHGGRIWVESKLGEGATFYFTLQRAAGGQSVPSRNGALGKSHETLAGAAPNSATRQVPAADDVNGASAAHLVVVDDQTEVGMIIQKLGKRDGLDVTWFPTAEDAWDYLNKAGADLLLLDVNLPGMNGIDLCQKLRKLPHLQRTPVAMFTPETDPERLSDLRAAGADFFLTKDLLCQPIQWQDKIQELLEQIRQPQ